MTNYRAKGNSSRIFELFVDLGKGFHRRSTTRTTSGFFGGERDVDKMFRKVGHLV